MKNIFSLLSLLALCIGAPQAQITPGELWLDNDGNHINAHGGGVLVDGDTFYWYGEHKAEDTCAALVGVMCYSSSDLEHWTCQGPALEVVDIPGHDIERGCTLERPKVIYCPKTGKYVMWFHLELKGQGYAAARYGVAVADKPTGPFEFLRSARVCPGVMPMNLNLAYDNVRETLKGFTGDWWTPEWYDAIHKGLFTQRDLQEGQMARDMTLYVDADGKAYHIYSSEDNLTLQIAELTDDFTEHTGRYVRMEPGGHNEAPAIFKHDGMYWMICSGCTGWDPNEARMYSAPSIWGPWTRHSNPCQGPGAELTFGGQSTYVLSLPGDHYVFMADIWRPEHPIDSRYVWLPIQWADSPDGPTCKVPTIPYQTSWDPSPLLANDRIE